MTPRILSPAQAQAAFAAVSALTDVACARFQVAFHGKTPMGRSTSTEFQLLYSGEIVIEMSGLDIDHREHYPDQNAFAATYGLQPPAQEPTTAPLIDSMGIPEMCGKPLCSPYDHHPLCTIYTRRDEASQAAHEREAFVTWMTRAYPGVYRPDEARQYWDHRHLSALAWLARASLPATSSSGGLLRSFLCEANQAGITHLPESFAQDLSRATPEAVTLDSAWKSQALGKIDAIEAGLNSLVVKLSNPAKPAAAWNDAVCNAAFQALESRGFRASASDIGADDMRAVFDAMLSAAKATERT